MSKQKLSYNFNATAGVMKPIIDFNCIVDTDFGLLLLIDREYLDTEIFSIDFFNTHHTVDKLLYALYKREKYNPLFLCLNDKNNVELANSLYCDFMKEKYSEILNLSMVTDMFTMTQTLVKQLGSGVTIICNNDLEIDCLKRLGSTADICLYENIDKIDRHNQFIFKTLSHPALKVYLPSIYENTFYLANYKFNDIDSEDIDSNMIYALGVNRCILNNIDIYNAKTLNLKIERRDS